MNYVIMKKIFCILFLFLSFSCFAQDVIVLKDASEIEAKVLVVGIDDITYKKWDFQDGPDYKIQKWKVLFIKYSNGAKEVFDEVQVTETKDTVTNRKLSKSYIKRNLFNTYIEAGCPFMITEAGASLNASLGIRIYDYAFVGLCLGADIVMITQTGDIDAQDIPMLLNIRGFIPVSKDLYPFLDFSVGPNFVLGKVQNRTVQAVSGRIRLCAGIEYKRLVAALGYDFITFGQGYDCHMGFAKIGVKIGKLQ